MADVQREKGHMDVANDIVRNVFIPGLLSKNQFQIVFIILDESWGWVDKRKPAENSHKYKVTRKPLSPSFFTERTGIALSHVQETIRELLEAKVINRHWGFYKFNKNYDTYLLGKLSYRKSNFPKKEAELPEKVSKTSRKRKFDAFETLKNEGENFPKERIKKERKTTVGNEKHFLTAIQEIVELYKQLKGWNSDPDWNEKHFTRHTKSAKELLRVCGENAEDAKSCMQWWAAECAKHGLDWTIETVTRKEPDYRIRDQKKAVNDVW